MRIPYNWLQDYLQADIEIERLCHLLTMGGLEVEEVRDWTATDGEATDQILMTAVTPNRGDLLSMIGVARHAAALSRTDFVDPVTSFPEIDNPVTDREKASIGPVTVEIADSVGCLRYSALLIEDVEVGPSPDWLRYRMEAAGIRSINNVVDCTNYVVWEMGQPLHAFDFRLLKDGYIIVRRAEDEEKLLLLDDTWQTLGPEDVVIADPMGAVALAGIMGGTDTQVSETTSRVLLESAHFDPVAIRRTSLRLGVSTEASYRFERHVDPNLTLPALARAAELIMMTAGGQIAHAAIDVKTRDFATKSLQLRPARCNSLLGTDLDAAAMADFLRRLGFGVEEGELLTVEVPTFRPDVEREIDLVEEVAIVYGYENIELTVPGHLTCTGRLTEQQRLRRRAGELLRECGLCENLSFSMMDPSDLDECHWPQDDACRDFLELANPASSDLTVMRTTLLPGLLTAAAHNARQRVSDIALYEIGTVFFPQDEQSLPGERQHVAVLMTGSLLTADWNLPVEQAQVDFYYMKGIIEQLCGGLGGPELSFVRQNHSTFHPGKCAQVLLGDETIGLMGEIAAEVAEAYDLPDGACASELNLDMLLERAVLYTTHQPVARFPAAERDLAIIVPDNDEFASARLIEEIEQAAGEFLESVTPFDVYSDPQQIGAGRKSIAFRLVFRADDRTLIDAEVEAVMSAVHSYVEEEVGAEVRK